MDDMSKAFDRMKWDYLEKVLLKLGFQGNLMSIIMQYVRSVHYLIQLNGEDICDNILSRGSRQGDPLLPYRFYLGIRRLIGTN